MRDTCMFSVIVCPKYCVCYTYIYSPLIVRAIGRWVRSIGGSVNGSPIGPSVDARRAKLVAHRWISGWRHGRIANTSK